MTTDSDKALLGVEMLYTKFASAPYVARQHWSTHRKFKLDPLYNEYQSKFSLDPLYNGQVSYEFVPDPLFNRSSE